MINSSRPELIGLGLISSSSGLYLRGAELAVSFDGGLCSVGLLCVASLFAIRHLGGAQGLFDLQGNRLGLESTR